MRQWLFRSFVRVSRTAAKVLPMRSMRLSMLIYRFVYRICRPRGATEIEGGSRGLRLVAPADDTYVIANVFGGYCEELERSLLERLAGASRVAVDAGANIGLHTCAMATGLPADGRVIAFEPVPQNLDYLRRNVAGNGLQDKVVVEGAAVGNCVGEVTIHLTPNNIAYHSASPKRAQRVGSTDSVTVPVVSLDSYFAGQDTDLPDLVKCDTEGYDGFVFEGAQGTVKRCSPTLIFEFMPPCLIECDYDPANLVEFVFGHYPHVFVIDEYCRRISRCTPDDLKGAVPKGNWHCANILATSRPDHLEIIESWSPADRICSRRLVG